MKAVREGLLLLRTHPWAWLAAGAMAWLSRMGPPVLTWWSAGSPALGPLAMDSPFPARTVMTATFWASLLGLWRFALESASARPPRIGAYLEGFFGGFLILAPAIAMEAALGSAETIGEAAGGRIVLAPAAGLGSLGLALIAARVPLRGWGARAKGLASPLGFAWLAWEAAAMAASLFGFLHLLALPDLVLAPVRLAIGAVVLRRLAGRR